MDKLPKPPIVEVVCGLKFPSIQEMDPVLLGVYWDKKREQYPKRQLHPPLSDQPLFFHGFGPLRTWFVSKDETFVLQIQPDRFYLNWRARESEYPRFNDHGGKSGVLTQMINEFKTLSNFCTEELNTSPKPNKIELAKIDHLLEGNQKHWYGLKDLGTALPWLASFVSFSNSDNAKVSMSLVEELDFGTLTVSVNLGSIRGETKTNNRLVKIESRIVADIPPQASDFRDIFQKSNSVLNNVFETLIPEDERKKRFSGEVS